MELKPCPFCGSNSLHLVQRPTNYDTIVFIQCDVCKAQTRAFKYYGSADFLNWNDEGSQYAISAWNNRAEVAK